MNELKKSDKKQTLTVTVYIVLRFLVIVCMIGQVFRGNWNNVFLCFLTLLLFTIPTIVDKKLNIKLPSTLEIIIYLFIFSSEILGEIQNFYGIFWHWDTILHVLNGFLMGAIGFSLVDILNRYERFHITLTPIFVSLVAFSFSMTIGVLWEFVEFGFDQYLKKDCQKDRIITEISSVELNKRKENIPKKIKNITRTKIYSKKGNKEVITVIPKGYLDIGLVDTMKDLFVNFIGAIVFSILGFLYIKDRDEYKFLEKFFPVLKKINT